MPEPEEHDAVSPEIIDPRERQQSPIPQNNSMVFGSEAAGYRGWLTEALERFRLQSRRRTIAEEIALRNLGHQWRAQDLSHQKLEADIAHFPTEDRIRGKELKHTEGELDIKLDEQEKRRKQAQEPKPVAKPSAPRDPVEERMSKIREHVMAVDGLKRACRMFVEERKAAGDMTLEEEAHIWRECKKAVEDIRERY